MAKSINEKYFHVLVKDIPIYRGKLRIILSNSVKDVDSLVGDFDEKNMFAHSIRDRLDDFFCYNIILNLDNDFSSITPGTIAHEAVHIMHMLFEIKGVMADLENDEPAAYMVDWIVEETFKFIHEKKLDGKIKIELYERHIPS